MCHSSKRPTVYLINVAEKRGLRIRVSHTLSQATQIYAATDDLATLQRDKHYDLNQGAPSLDGQRFICLVGEIITLLSCNLGNSQELIRSSKSMIPQPEKRPSKIFHALGHIESRFSTALLLWSATFQNIFK